MYEGSGLDVAAAAGTDRQLLPIPMVFIIDTDGSVVYARPSFNHRERPDIEEILGSIP
jgi:peroxiredoxin